MYGNGVKMIITAATRALRRMVLPGSMRLKGVLAVSFAAAAASTSRSSAALRTGTGTTRTTVTTTSVSGWPSPSSSRESRMASTEQAAALFPAILPGQKGGLYGLPEAAVLVAAGEGSAAHFSNKGKIFVMKPEIVREIEGLFPTSQGNSLCRCPPAKRNKAPERKPGPSHPNCPPTERNGHSRPRSGPG